jgi:hypothetical protein
MRNFSIAILIATAALFASCANDPAIEQAVPETAPGTRAVTKDAMRQCVYIEVNDVDPRNAISWEMNGGKFFDNVILFAANIRGDKPNQGYLHFNPQVTNILNNADTYIAPIQAAGIKVSLGLLGDHTGLGFCNLTATQRTAFITAICDAVKTYGLDGVDFDDEWAKYGTNGFPAANNTSWSALINDLRAAFDADPDLTDKLITVFAYGGQQRYLSSAAGSIDAAWYSYIGGYSGSGSVAPSGLTKAQWSPMFYQLDNLNTANLVQGRAQTAANAGFGWITSYNLRDNANATSVTRQASTLNAIGMGAYGYPVTHNGTWY